MKKLISLICAAALMLCMCSCSNKATPYGHENRTLKAVGDETYTNWSYGIFAFLGEAGLRQALLPSDGDFFSLSSQRIIALVELYNVIHEDSMIPVARVSGKSDIDEFKKHNSIDSSEASSLNEDRHYCVFFLSDLEKVMSYFYDINLDRKALSDCADLVSSSGLVFVVWNGVVPSAPSAQVSFSDISFVEGKAIIKLKALSFSAASACVTDEVSGFAAALGVTKASSTFDGMVKDAKIPADQIGYITVTLYGDGEQVWIESCEYHVTAGYATMGQPTLRVRKGPDTKYDKLGNLDMGTKVCVYEEKNGWGRVVFGGKEGWISLEYSRKLQDAS